MSSPYKMNSVSNMAAQVINAKKKLSTEDCYIINTTSHPELARKISYYTNIPILSSHIEYFANGECRPILSDSVRGKNIFIISSPNNFIENERTLNDHIIETYILIRTCRRSDVACITLICPYFPYARQDKKDNSRGCISAKDIADLYTLAGINRIVCIDLHSPQIQGFFNIPCDNIYSFKPLKEYLEKNLFKKFNISGNNDINNPFVQMLHTMSRTNGTNAYTIVAPDEGALKRVKNYANLLHLPFMVISKERDYTKLNKVEKVILLGDNKYIKDRTAIVIDDMMDTCGTAINVVELLMTKGARDVILIATHGIFSKEALTRINENNNIKMVIVSNSLPQENHIDKCCKLQQFDISGLLGEVIMHLNQGSSLSELFII